ncbi:MAG: ribonuclease III [Clostridia bacterium]|nr:ribonuclease III [Clostridia bacterium]
MIDVVTEGKDPFQMPAASLAYLGDAVYEIEVRTALVLAGVQKPSVASLRYVTACAQCQVLERILPCLNERENDIYHRGRNCVHNMPPKSCTMSEYRRATGLEALFGYLWLAGEKERLAALCRIGFAGMELYGSDDVPEEAKGTENG